MSRSDNFTPEALEALFDYLEDLESSSIMEVELDVIGLCCEFTEYESLEDFHKDYSSEYETLDDIGNMTTVIEFGNGKFIIHAF
jgi:hypothetical protein